MGCEQKCLLASEQSVLNAGSQTQQKYSEFINRSDDKKNSIGHLNHYKNLLPGHTEEIICNISVTSSEQILLTSIKKVNKFCHLKTSQHIKPLRSIDNECNTRISKESIINSPIKKNSLYIERNKVNVLTRRGVRAKTQPRLSLLILFLALLGSQNAFHCLGFGYPMYYNNPSISGYNYPCQPSTMLNSDSTIGNPSHRIVVRQPGDGPMQTLPLSGRLTNDPSDLSPHVLGDWTSILSNPFNAPKDSLDGHIRKILIPRVSGTDGIATVREYIVNVLKANSYHVELDEFTGPTPVGDVKFSNIIASSNPKACRQLVLACHYDSKKMDGFLGASDSAVPCAMLLEMSETFKDSFRPTSDSAEDSSNQLGLRFIFFDGEEAFVRWSPTDSLYGSRHLAQKWEKQPAPPHCGSKNELSRMEMLVVLDLIGPSDTSFVYYNNKLVNHYRDMQKYERAYLTKYGLSASQIRRDAAFKSRYIPLDFLEDDHVPFKQRGVPIFSLLAHPFPSTWHTIDDNYASIDFERTRRILHVIQEFVANYRKGND